MFRKNARLIPTTEKGGLATPLWSDSKFKSLLGVQMNLIVTEKVRQELTQKYEIHPDKTWSVDECKKVLGACIRKNNVKGIICCHREFSVTLATQQSQRNSELEKQNNELRARVSALTKKLNRNKASAKTDVEEVSQPDNNYPDLQDFFETDVTIQSVTDVPVDSVKVCGARRRSQGIEGIESVPPNSSVVQVQTVRVGYRNPVPIWHRYLWNRYVLEPNQNADFGASFRCHARAIDSNICPLFFRNARKKHHRLQLQIFQQNVYFSQSYCAPISLRAVSLARTRTAALILNDVCEV